MFKTVVLAAVAGLAIALSPVAASAVEHHPVMHHHHMMMRHHHMVMRHMMHHHHMMMRHHHMMMHHHKM